MVTTCNNICKVVDTMQCSLSVSDQSLGGSLMFVFLKSCHSNSWELRPCFLLAIFSPWEVKTFIPWAEALWSTQAATLSGARILTRILQLCVDSA